MAEEQGLPAGVKKERRTLCVVCKSRISKKIDNKIIWIGHYSTPEGIFCVDCYKQKGLSRMAM